MDYLNQIGTWLGGAVAVVGLLQWAKAFAPGAPKWVWGLAAAMLAAAYSLAPDWARMGAGILAVSQIGYETIIQTVKRKAKGE